MGTCRSRCGFGEFVATELLPAEAAEELQRLSPAELLVPRWLRDREELQAVIDALPRTAVEGREDWVFDRDAGHRPAESALPHTHP